MARAPVPQSKQSAFKQATKAAFEEVYADTPESVEKSGKTGEAKRKMLAAIAISKARRRMGIRDK